MRLRGPRSLHEIATEHLLRRGLGGTDWVIGVNTSLQSVLEKDRTLTPAEFSLYTRGHLDFVVYRADDGQPEFAIEFDGLAHQEPIQVERDIIKNRLCAEAELPLLRIGHDELRERTEVSVLEWLLERFVTWMAESDDAAEQMLSELSGTPDGVVFADELAARPDDLIGVVAATFSDAVPFPANAELARRLYSEYGITLAGPPGDEFRHHPMTLEISWPGVRRFEDGPAGSYLVCERRAVVRGPAGALLETIGRGRFAAAHRTGSGPHDFVDVKLPWLDADWIAEDLALHDALVRVESWARARVSA